MTNTSRRGLLKALGAMGAGLIVEPLIVVPERKIWVVGTQLHVLVSHKPRRVRVPEFEMVTLRELFPPPRIETVVLPAEDLKLTNTVYELLGVALDLSLSALRASPTG